jgi:hypothetical protein
MVVRLLGLWSHGLNSLVRCKKSDVLTIVHLLSMRVEATAAGNRVGGQREVLKVSQILFE